MSQEDITLSPSQVEKTIQADEKHRYSRELLLKLQTHPLACKLPPCLDNDTCSIRGVWDPEKWSSGGKKHTNDHMDPRNSRPRPQDGGPSPRQQRSSTMGGRTPRSTMNAERSTGRDRFGSGRLTSRDRDSWNFQPDHPGGRDKSDRRQSDDRYDGRRLSDSIHDYQRGRERNNTRRSRSLSQEEEPEWYSSGPTSRMDTIELKGFDDDNEETRAQRKMEHELAKDRNLLGVFFRDRCKIQDQKAHEGSEAGKVLNDVRDILFKMNNAPEQANGVHPTTSCNSSHIMDIIQNVAKLVKADEDSDHPEKGRMPSMKELTLSGKVTLVDDVETKLKKEVAERNLAESGMSPFHRLLSKLADGRAVSAFDNKEQARENMNFLKNAPTEQDILLGKIRGQQMQQRPQQIMPDAVMKLLQQRQSEIVQQAQAQAVLQNAMSNPLAGLPMELQAMITHAKINHNQLQSSDAQSIIQGLVTGKISYQQLLQHLQHGSLNPRLRNIVASIIKLQLQQNSRYQQPMPNMHQRPSYGYGPQQQQPMHHVQQHHNQYNPGLPHRVPSAQELVAHTQHIMQNALMKKKIEEQQQHNFQCQQHQHQLFKRHSMPNMMSSNSVVKSSAGFSDAALRQQPNTFAFMPTSVMRKISSEKEKEDCAAENDASVNKASTSTGSVEEMNAFSEQPSTSSKTDETDQGKSQTDVASFPNQTQAANVSDMMQQESTSGSTSLNDIQQNIMDIISKKMDNSNDLQSVGALGRWFSSDFLAQASSGNTLPTTIRSQAMTVDQLEQATAVQN